MKIVKKVDLDIYPVSVIFCVGEEKNEIIKELDKFGIYYSTDDYDCMVEGLDLAGFTYQLDEPHEEGGKKKRTVFVQYQQKKSTNDYWRKVLAHETLHLTHSILDFIGQEAVPFDDDEILVYLFDYLFGKGLEITS